MRRRLGLVPVIGIALLLAGCGSPEALMAEAAERERAYTARRWAICKNVCPAELRPALLPKGCACLPADVKVMP